MRPDGDRRPSAVVKLHELRRLRRESIVDLLVDDDPSRYRRRTRRGLHRAARRVDVALAAADPAQASLFDDDLLHDAQQREGRT